MCLLTCFSYSARTCVCLCVCVRACVRACVRVCNHTHNIHACTHKETVTCLHV